MAEGDQPPHKKIKLEEFTYDKSDCKRINGIAASINSCKEINEAIDNLISIEHFCFFKFKNCNGAFPVCFSKAWCAGVRNSEEVDKKISKTRVRFSDLFDVALLQNLLKKSEDVRLDKMQMMSFGKLSRFLAKIDDVSRVLENHQNSSEAEWAAVFGTHVLRPLALMESMVLSDSGYTRIKDCPCGCEIPVSMGDTSMGHENVWHGSVDILLASNVAVFNTLEDPETLKDEGESAFEMKSHNIETKWQQIMAQTIVFALLKKMGVVPTIAISKQAIKIYMYDPDNDLFFESTEMDLFPERGEQVLNTHTVLALWFAINYCHFCTGTKPSHIEFGYKADFYSYLTQTALNTYKNKLHFGKCKYGERTRNKFSYSRYEKVEFL